MAEYDRDSFLAGLAVGRSLWRPPILTPKIPYVYWTADPEFLVYDGDTFLCHQQNTWYNRDYYKLRDGKAIGVYVKDWDNQYGTDWYGPVLISPDSASVGYTNAAGWVGEVDYMGLTWYYNTGYHITSRDGEVLYITDLVEYGPDAGPNNADNVLRVLAAANVRVYGV